MWVIRRVTVDLPLVPVIETTGMRLASSRIHARWGRAEAAAIRSCHRATRPGLGARQAARRAGETAGSARSGGLGDRAGHVPPRARDR